MFLLLTFVCTVFTVQIRGQLTHFGSETHFNAPFCASDKKCTFIEYCPSISNLMEQNLLPIHRFRQAICGYDGIKAKVCCDADGNSVDPMYTEQHSVSFPNPSSLRQCGKSLVRSNIETVGSYPFVARIGFISVTGETKYSCNGVILNDQTVLTTASCALATSESYKLNSILVGEFDMQTDPDCNSLFCGHRTQRYNISCVIKHPYYKPENFANNVALLHLETPILFSVTVQPICILPKDKYVNVGNNCVLVGWGKLARDRVNTVRQQALKMKVLSLQQCSQYYNQGLSVELCVIGDDIPCSGYSGSPLLVKYSDTYYLVGILSYGSSCDSRMNYPSAFIDVQRYAQWILENC